MAFGGSVERKSKIANQYAIALCFAWHTLYIVFKEVYDNSKERAGFLVDRFCHRHIGRYLYMSLCRSPSSILVGLLKLFLHIYVDYSLKKAYCSCYRWPCFWWRTWNRTCMYPIQFTLYIIQIVIGTVLFNNIYSYSTSGLSCSDLNCFCSVRAHWTWIRDNSWTWRFCFYHILINYSASVDFVPSTIFSLKKRKHMKVCPRVVVV